MTLDELKQEFQKLVLGESYEREFKQYLKNKGYAQSTIDVYYIPTLGGIFNQIFDEDIFKIQSSDLDFLNKCLDEFHQGCLNKYNINGGAPRNCLRQYIAYLKEQIIPSKFTDIEKEKFLEIIQEFLDKVDELRSTGKTTGSMPTQFEKSMNEVLQNLDYVCNFSFGQGILSSVPFINFCPKNILNKDLVNGDKLSGRRGIYIGFGYDYNKQKLDLVIGYGNNDTQECEAKNEIDKYRPNEWEYTYKRDEFGKIKDQIVKDFLNLVSEFNQIPIEYFKPKGAEVIQQTNKSANETNGVPPLNQILYGPPGTGKTYNTINKALEILGVETQGKSRAELKAQFDKFRQNGQIEFVTFHQSFSYEEFVEGIKPKFINSNEGAESSKMEYEIKSGIFKQICKKALKNLEDSQKDEAELKNESKVDNLFEAFIEHIQNEQENGGEYILKQNAKKDKNWLVVLLDSGNYKVIKIFSHSGYLEKYPVFLNGDKIKAHYSDFKADNSFKIPSNENRTGYIDTHRFYSAFFKKMQEFETTWQDISKDSGEIDFNQKALKPYILIIDEINRGNISKILGELITLIEPSKRIGADEELRVSLPYSANEFDGGKGFGVPKNLYIIGTMNTADRSIALLDTALRRRFEFVEMMPEPELLEIIKVENSEINLQILLEKMNARIEFLLDREHTIGHSFFINVNSLSELQQVFKNKIIPLLQEYFYDDYAKIDSVLNGNGMVKAFSQGDLGVKLSDEFVDSEKQIYRITDFSSWDIDTFTQIYGSKNTDKSNENE